MSKLIPTFKGTVKDSKVIFDNRAYFDLYVGTLDGQRVTVVVNKLKKLRSLKSNAYYWVYLGLIAEETGNDMDLLHDLFKNKFLPKASVTIKGVKELVAPSTTTLSTIEMSDYIRAIEGYTGILAPDPSEYYKA